MFVKFLKFVAENPRIPFYPFIFLYHENMKFRVFCGIFNEFFKKFQILFFPYMKLQLLTNNVFIIFDNCAFKIQNSKKTSFLDGVINRREYLRMGFFDKTFAVLSNINFRKCSVKHVVLSKHSY